MASEFKDKELDRDLIADMWIIQFYSNMPTRKKVEDAKGYIDSSLSAKLHSYKEQYQLDHIFVDCVKWDVLHSIMEFAYTDCKRLPNFFLDLLQIYENL
ncbi:hypothetical protein [Paenibacillus sp. FSL K6-1318]|uniref:hypothetical protein n=1 Tax=Paenibacillus sp. FSL K6-1318 TaxID=2975291 RepID=UPI0030EBBBB4